MKTAEDIVAELPYKSKYERVELIKAYALQVAEAVLSDAEDKIAEYIDTPIDCDDELFQQGIKRGLLEIKKVNITDFIK